MEMADLKKKLIYTFFMLLLFRIGSAIPVPFLETGVLKNFIEQSSNNWLGYIDLLSGGSFSQSTLFALGISPYITASIVIQLLAVAIPALENLAKEGEEGRKLLNKYTPLYHSSSCGTQCHRLLLHDAEYGCTLLYRGLAGHFRSGRHHRLLHGGRHAGDVGWASRSITRGSETAFR